MKNKKILWVGEASYTLSGFGTYSYEVLKRLYQSGKFDIAELAGYAYIDDIRTRSVPWKLYCNAINPRHNHDPRLKQLNENPINQFGAWRFERVCLDFKPNIVCTPPGELILTEYGYKKIENISVLDRVITHTGKLQKVIQLLKNEYVGNIHNIAWYGCAETLKLTPEHPVYIIRKRKQTNQKKSFKKIYDGVEPEFVPAKDVKVGDLIVLTKPYLKNLYSLNVKHFLKDYQEKDGRLHLEKFKTHNQSLPLIIKLEETLGRLLGYIISDGYIYKRGVKITFNSSELRFVKDSISILENIFNLRATYRKYKHKNAYNVYCNSTLFASFIKNLTNKHKIPKIIFDSNLHFIEGLIKGLVRGDGCYKKNTISFANKDKYVANIYRILCLILGIPTNLSLNKYNLSYEICGYGTSATQLHNLVKKHKTEKEYKKGHGKICRRTHMIGQYLVSSVKTNQITNYAGVVYNLEVEQDNSYIIQQSVVHNCDIRDPWMLMYQQHSPLRKYFHLVWMPTCDSSPQQEDWIDHFIKADKILTYCDWGLKILQKEGGGLINLYKAAPPGVDIDVFKPQKNKIEHRRKMGFGSEAIIFGTIMRNQRRKLFPDLLESFGLFLKKCILNKREDLAKNAFLYFHVSWPDVAGCWNLPRLLKEHGLGHKVLFTYICESCKTVFVSLFQDARTICPRCKNISAILPSVSMGLTREQLADIYNIFDVYIQYASNEGFGMPQVEAAACSVPIMATDYSAMEDVIRKLDGYPIKVARLNRVVEEDAYKAMPDNNDLADKLYKFSILSLGERRAKGQRARDAVEKYYTWDNTAKIWETYFDSLELDNKWENPPSFLETKAMPNDVPQNLNNEDFVQWAIINILGDTSYLNSLMHLEMVKALNYGLVIALNSPPQPYSRNNVIDKLVAMKNTYNHCEQARCGMIPLQPEDYIAYANRRR